MSLADLLEDFCTTASGNRIVAQGGAMPADQAETLRLAAFEDGYKAGWDDATNTSNETQARISSLFAQNMQDLSFTYHEAVAHVSKALKPVFRQIVGSVLPELTQGALCLQIAERLEEQVNRNLHPDVRIQVSREDEAAARRLLDRDFGFPVSVGAVPELVAGQAEMSFGDEEVTIDLNGAVDDIREILAGFSHENERILANG